MKKRYHGWIWLCLAFTFCYCQRAAFQPEALQQDYLTFGKGGGMTNQVETYYILEDGQVYQHNNLVKEYRHLGRLKKADRKACFEHAAALPASLFGCDEPGNLYYFLSVHSQDTTKSCTWGKNDFTPPAEITSFYQHIHQLADHLAP